MGTRRGCVAGSEVSDGRRRVCDGRIEYDTFVTYTLGTLQFVVSTSVTYC